MTDRAIRIVFLSGAIYNMAVAVALAFATTSLFGLLRVTPTPEEPLFLHLFAWLVFLFGIAYHWISTNPAEHIPLIRLGILGKLGIVVLGLTEVLAGVVSWQIMAVACVDLVYVALFWWALRSLRGATS